jgi:hypothetical protein
MCFLLIPNAIAGQSPLLKWKDTTRWLGPGFGDQWNKYAWSMQDYEGYMYVGTSNVHFDIIGAFQDPDFLDCVANLPPGNNPALIFTCFTQLGYQDSSGSEIWRYRYTHRSWEQVYDSAVDPPSGGFRKLIVYEDELYASSSDFTGTAQLLVTDDGVNWTPVANPPELQCWSYRALAVYDGWLYVGSDCGDLWRYDGEGTWEKIADGVGPVGVGVTDLAAYRGRLYAGSGNQSGEILLYEVDQSGNVVNASPTVVDGVDLTTLNNTGVLKLYVYNGELFLGTANFSRGFTFLRYDGSQDEWSVITVDGFGFDRNTYVWSMAEFEGKLYMGTFTSDFLSALDGGGGLDLGGDLDLGDVDLSWIDLLTPSAQLWSSCDGRNWEQLRLPMFGFGIWNYGFRNMAVGEDGSGLFLGTGSNLFAPDADELIDLLLSGLISGDGLIGDLLEGSTEGLAIGGDDGLLARLIGPGTQVWVVRSVYRPRSCGRGFELAFLVLSPLMWLSWRRRRSRH